MTLLLCNRDKCLFYSYSPDLSKGICTKQIVVLDITAYAENWLVCKGYEDTISVKAIDQAIEEYQKLTDDLTKDTSFGH